jgi:hypothetical protein
MNDYPTTTARKREGRCYQLAAMALIYLPQSTAWRLVHGEVNGEHGTRIGHAWHKLDGTVWDPVSNARFDAEIYRVRYQAVELATYSQPEAAKIVSISHFGPWPNEWPRDTDTGALVDARPHPLPRGQRRIAGAAIVMSGGAR